MSGASNESGLSVAVVMCTYNGAQFVAEQLESLFAQTRQPDHLVIVDDASTDDTYALVEQLCTQRPPGMRLTLECNARNLGYVANFDHALSLADEDILFLCDQDDIWHAGKVERMVREFACRPDLDLLHTDARLVDAAGEPLGYGLFSALELSESDRAALHAGRGFDVVLRHSVVTGATAAVRRDAARRAAPFPAHWVHDEWLAITCALSGRIDCLEEAWIDYRQHGGNQLGAAKRSGRERFASGASRRALMQRIEARLEVLLERLDVGQFIASDAQRDALRDRLCHARVRAHLPVRTFARIGRVAKEWARGGYGRHSFGLRSAVADLAGLG
ncbi:glycosyltransferase family 2 protein [Cognatilysobacter bugurensis]|uniref:Glycosyltransferase 2-like domain-containing protein n=1 Tax=Cognatilysobacter bugurensis TaxID=543356 RepID=A0A918T4A5_9GAMM|nr:glycosyltransferase family 2 protein [Lysobacter bugurensis]GHA88878.1 hypothetical protein GCM10007067_28460 [Lysobacter bugurensis]